MDFIIEILVAIIFEGALESITEKKIPVFIRVIIAAGLLVFYFGFIGLLIYIGIKYKSGIVIGIAMLVLVIVAYVTFKKYKELMGRD